MASSKPRGVCWCDCHKAVDEEGKPVFPRLTPWPRYADPVALATACRSCAADHAIYITSGIDPYSTP